MCAGDERIRLDGRRNKWKRKKDKEKREEEEKQVGNLCNFSPWRFGITMGFVLFLNLSPVMKYISTMHEHCYLL